MTEAPKAQRIVILGMHRSGTSLLAQMVRAWGASPGDDADLMPADEVNPEGYGELVPLVKLDDALLAATGSNWFCPPVDDAAVRALAGDPAFRQRALELVAKMDSQSPVWYWKDPRLSVLLPFWQEIWGDVVYLLPLRDPLESARSIAKRDGHPISASLLLWQRSMLSVLEHTKHSPRILLQYEALVSVPELGSRRLASELDEACGREATSRATLAAMAATARPALRRNRVEEDFTHSPVGTPTEKDLYAYAERLLLPDPEPFDAARFPLYPGWREYLETVVALQAERVHLHELAVDRDRRLEEKDRLIQEKEDQIQAYRSPRLAVVSPQAQ